MPRLSSRSSALVSTALTAALMSVSVSAQPSPSQASIVIAPFESLAEASTALAESMRSDLAATLDRDPCITARADRETPERPATYILRGSAYAEAGRAFVALQLVDAETRERLWFENYDYRGIDADMMARDILRYLKSIAPDSVRSRLARSCSGP